MAVRHNVVLHLAGGRPSTLQLAREALPSTLFWRVGRKYPVVFQSVLHTIAVLI